MDELDLIPGSDESALPSETYHLVVSPALQVTAELAAARGDRDLYNDMAAMLTLRALIRWCGERYLKEHADAQPLVRDSIQAAPDATCAMVLKRAELSPKQLNECLWALDAAGQQLAEADVLSAGHEQFDPAWQDLAQGEREQAIARLKFVAGALVGRIDNWERKRDAAREQAATNGVA